nr:sugar porter family MFS transporter [Sphingomonas sp. CARO-RG-8B-R24-01]
MERRCRRSACQVKSVLVASIITAALAGLLFGFDTAVIAGVTADLRHVYRLTPETLGVTVSAALWGTLVGALVTGGPGDRFGSRRVLGVLGLCYIAAGVGCALATDWSAFLAFRFVCGLAIGGSSVLAPVYIAEVAPPARRGLLVGLFQLAIVAGILIAYLSNAIVAVLIDHEAWRWKLGVSAAPAIVFVALLFRIPDSPRWLVARARVTEARVAFARIGLSPTDADQEIERILGALAIGQSDGRLSWSLHRRPIVLAVVLAAFNQLAGINAVLYYLNDIFARAGSLSPDLQAITIGAANLIFTLLGMVLIDRIGRKPLLAAGAAGMTLCLSIAALVLFGRIGGSVLLPALVGFIAFFATSQGAVIWVYLSEIFPQDVRARGSALGASTHWLFNAVIAGVFPMLVAWSAGAPFVIFATAMAAQCVVVLLIFPETKGIALDAIRERMV